MLKYKDPQNINSALAINSAYLGRSFIMENQTLNVIYMKES